MFQKNIILQNLGKRHFKSEINIFHQKKCLINRLLRGDNEHDKITKQTSMMKAIIVLLCYQVGTSKTIIINVTISV